MGVLEVLAAHIDEITSYDIFVDGGCIWCRYQDYLKVVIELHGSEICIYTFNILSDTSHGHHTDAMHQIDIDLTDPQSIANLDKVIGDYVCSQNDC